MWYEAQQLWFLECSSYLSLKTGVNVLIPSHSAPLLSPYFSEIADDTVPVLPVVEATCLDLNLSTGALFLPVHPSWVSVCFYLT